MTKIMYAAVVGMLFVLSINTSSVYAQNNFSSPGIKANPAVERARSESRSFGMAQSREHKKAKTKVPSSMDLFVDRCKEAGGGLISIDGHYDCVKPSGEPIPDW